jgi:hypothetical protein
VQVQTTQTRTIALENTPNRQRTPHRTKFDSLNLFKPSWDMGPHKSGIMSTSSGEALAPSAQCGERGDNLLMPSSILAKLITDRYIHGTSAMGDDSSASSTRSLRRVKTMNFVAKIAAFALLLSPYARLATRNGKLDDKRGRRGELDLVEPSAQDSAKNTEDVDDARVVPFRLKSTTDLPSNVVETARKFRLDRETGAITGIDRQSESPLPRSGDDQVNSHVIGDLRIENMSDLELSIFVTMEAMNVFRDIFREHSDVLPADLLKDLQQATDDVVHRLSEHNAAMENLRPERRIPGFRGRSNGFFGNGVSASARFEPQSAHRFDHGRLGMRCAKAAANKTPIA